MKRVFVITVIRKGQGHVGREGDKERICIKRVMTKQEMQKKTRR